MGVAVTMAKAQSFFRFRIPLTFWCAEDAGGGAQCGVPYECIPCVSDLPNSPCCVPLPRKVLYTWMKTYGEVEPPTYRALGIEHAEA